MQDGRPPTRCPGRRRLRPRPRASCGPRGRRQRTSRGDPPAARRDHAGRRGPGPRRDPAVRRPALRRGSARLPAAADIRGPRPCRRGRKRHGPTEDAEVRHQPRVPVCAHEKRRIHQQRGGAIRPLAGDRGKDSDAHGPHEDQRRDHANQLARGTVRAALDRGHRSSIDDDHHLLDKVVPVHRKARRRRPRRARRPRRLSRCPGAGWTRRARPRRSRRAEGCGRAPHRWARGALAPRAGAAT